MKPGVLCLIGGTLFILLGACAAPGTMSQNYAAQTSSTLWNMHFQTSDPLQIAYIEAELGSRGQTSFGVDYLGRTTASAYGKRLYRREAASSTDVNCKDFPSAAEAQKYFLARGGPVSDPEGLDRDGDGLACEWGTQLRKSASRYSVRIQPRRQSSSYCHIGPRGGRYTITASGAKNYGGC